jgi:hypothetical protein
MSVLLVVLVVVVLAPVLPVVVLLVPVQGYKRDERMKRHQPVQCTGTSTDTCTGTTCMAVSAQGQMHEHHYPVLYWGAP